MSSNLETNNKYTSNYSDTSFWNLLKKGAKSIGAIPLCYALALYYIMQHDKVSVVEKGMIIGALGYLIFPVDMIPDITPLLGFTDDAGVMALLISKMKNSIDDTIVENIYLKINQWFPLSKKEIKAVLLKAK